MLKHLGPDSINEYGYHYVNYFCFRICGYLHYLDHASDPDTDHSVNNLVIFSYFFTLDISSMLFLEIY